MANAFNASVLYTLVYTFAYILYAIVFCFTTIKAERMLQTFRD